MLTLTQSTALCLLRMPSNLLFRITTPRTPNHNPQTSEVLVHPYQRLTWKPWWNPHSPRQQRFKKLIVGAFGTWRFFFPRVLWLKGVLVWSGRAWIGDRMPGYRSQERSERAEETGLIGLVLIQDQIWVLVGLFRGGLVFSHSHSVPRYNIVVKMKHKIPTVTFSSHYQQWSKQWLISFLVCAIWHNNIWCV